MPSDGPTHGLAIRHLRPADVGGDLELADHAVHEDVEVQLAHAGDERLATLRVRLDAEGRVLLRQPLQRDAQLVLVGLGLGLDLDLDDRLRERHRLEDDRMLGIGQGVAGEGLLEADGGGDVARVDLFDLLAVVGVHLEDAADPLLAVLRARCTRTSPDLSVPEYTRKNASLPDERVRRDLEGERAERLLVVRRCAAARRACAGPRR